MAAKSPLYELESSQGAVFAPYFGWEIPKHYGDSHGEYRAVRGGVGSMDLSYLGKLRVSDKDRARYLQDILSNDIMHLVGGTGCYAALFTHQGRMESDLFVYYFPQEYLLECQPASKERLLGTLKKYSLGHVVTIEDLTENRGILSLQGPQARQVMEETLGVDLSAQAQLEMRTIKRVSGDWIVVRRDRTGSDGYDLWVPADDLSAVWSAWQGKGIQAVGLDASNWLRIEAGIPWYGTDIDEHSIPMEFNLSSAVSTIKGCYRGREMLERVLHRGHLRRGFGAVAVDCPEPPPHGAEIRLGEDRIGVITSAAYSPRLISSLGLAIIKLELLKPGTRVEVIWGDNRYPGKIVELPLIPQ